MGVRMLSWVLLLATTLTACVHARPGPVIGPRTASFEPEIWAAWEGSRASYPVEFYADPSVGSSVAATSFYLTGAPVEVVFDPSVMHAIAWAHGSDAVVGVFCHELGHATDYHAGRLSALTRREAERSADMQAGCCLARAGREPDALVAFIADGAEDDEASPGYPTTEERAAAVELGHHLCSL